MRTIEPTLSRTSATHQPNLGALQLSMPLRLTTFGRRAGPLAARAGEIAGAWQDRDAALPPLAEARSGHAAR